MNVTYFPGQPDIELICTVSGGVPLWLINGSAVTLNQLSMNVIPDTVVMEVILSFLLLP